MDSSHFIKDCTIQREQIRDKKVIMVGTKGHYGDGSPIYRYPEHMTAAQKVEEWFHKKNMTSLFYDHSETVVHPPTAAFQMHNLGPAIVPGYDEMQRLQAMQASQFANQYVPNSTQTPKTPTPNYSDLLKFYKEATEKKPPGF